MFTGSAALTKQSTHALLVSNASGEPDALPIAQTDRETRVRHREEGHGVPAVFAARS